MTTLVIGGLGWPELVIILVVVLLLFGGTKLAGLGKSTGRALREFKEETKDLRKKDDKETQAIQGETVEAEFVEPTNEELRRTEEQRHAADTRRDV